MGLTICSPHCAGNKIIRKRLHPAPRLNNIYPKLNMPYVEAEHSKLLLKDLKIHHLPIAAQTKLHALIIKYFPVFNLNSLFIPVKDYQCFIDAGDARPTSSIHRSLSKEHQPDPLWAIVIQSVPRPKALPRICHRHL